MDDSQDLKSKMIESFISANYSPIGIASSRIYKTSADLVYDISEVISLSTNDIAKALLSSNYVIRYIAGVPYWEMYELVQVEY